MENITLADVEKKAVMNYDFSIKNVAETILKKKKIVVMAGAGMSVSAGIPDFRSPGTGLYSNLEKYDLPSSTSPEDLFTIDYFKDNPMPFTLRAHCLMPGQFLPTPTHHFIKLLSDKGLLSRVYTQNIDTLEVLAGIPADKTVFAHGSFADVHCIGDERHPVALEAWRAQIDKRDPPRCKECDALVKPDIVFFGENLPERYVELRRTDLEEADMLIIVGTSLQVHPFCSLLNETRADIPRVLINLQPSGEHLGLLFDHKDNYRDVFLKGTCDDQVKALCKVLGWTKDLDRLMQEQKKKENDGWKIIVEAQKKKRQTQPK